MRETEGVGGFVMLIDKSECVGCGCCVGGIDMREGICPVGAISIVGSSAEIDQSKCVNCGRCKDYCGVGAISDGEK